MDYKYKIFNISELDSIDWGKFTHCIETCRKSLDGSKFIVTFKNEPDTDYLSHSEALLIISTPEWSINEEE